MKALFVSCRALDTKPRVVNFQLKPKRCGTSADSLLKPRMATAQGGHNNIEKSTHDAWWRGSASPKFLCAERRMETDVRAQGRRAMQAMAAPGSGHQHPRRREHKLRNSKREAVENKITTLARTTAGSLASCRAAARCLADVRACSGAGFSKLSGPRAGGQESTGLARGRTKLRGSSGRPGPQSKPSARARQHCVAGHLLRNNTHLGNKA